MSVTGGKPVQSERCQGAGSNVDTRGIAIRTRHRGEKPNMRTGDPSDQPKRIDRSKTTTSRNTATLSLCGGTSDIAGTRREPVNSQSVVLRLN